MSGIDSNRWKWVRRARHASGYRLVRGNRRDRFYSRSSCLYGMIDCRRSTIHHDCWLSTICARPFHSTFHSERRPYAAHIFLRYAIELCRLLRGNWSGPSDRLRRFRNLPWYWSDWASEICTTKGCFGFAVRAERVLRWQGSRNILGIPVCHAVLDIGSQVGLIDFVAHVRSTCVLVVVIAY